MKETTTNSGRKTIYTRTFENISELLYWTSLDQQNTKAFGTGKCSSETGDPYFTGTKNYMEANELLKNGWDQGAKDLNTKLKIANMSNHTKDVQRAVNDIVGFQVNVPRYLQGVPTNMINKRSVKQKQKIITLVKSISYSGGVDKSRIMEDSVKFLQLVQEIEKQGIRVNIDVCLGSEVGNEQALFRVRIKKANERLNISKMSFPLVHPSFLRRILFKVMENETRFKNYWGSGYGRPIDRADYKNILDKTEHFIPVLVSKDEMLNIVNQSTAKK
jgi:hypothetical protein